MNYSKIQSDKLYLMDQLFDDVTAVLFMNNIQFCIKNGKTELEFKYINYSEEDIQKTDIIRMCKTLDIPYQVEKETHVFDVIKIKLDVSQYE